MALSGHSGWNNFGAYNSFAIQMWWSATQNIAGNYSDVSVTINVRSNNSGSSFSTNSQIAININGDVAGVNQVVTVNRGSTTSNIYTRTVRVPHNGDGNKTFDIRTSFSNGVSGQGNTADTVTLDPIGRAYDFIYGSNTVEMDTPLTVKVLNNGSGFKVAMVMAFGNIRKTVYDNAPIDTNFGVVMKSEDFASVIPNAPVGIGVLIAETWNGATKIGERSLPLNLTIPNSLAPTNDVTCIEANGKVVDTLGSNSTFIQSLSQVQIFSSASAKYGATITQYRYELDSKGIDSTNANAVINLADNAELTGNTVVKVTVKDSRGLTNTVTQTIDILPYSPPYLSEFTTVRSTTKNTEVIVTKPVKVSSIKVNNVEKNSYTVALLKRESTAFEWTEVGQVETNVSATRVITGMDITKSYVIGVQITDKFNSIILKSSVSTMQALIDFYKDEGIGVNKLYEEGHGVLDVGGDIFMNGKSLLDTFYPIGSIYMSVMSTNPSYLMGGSWIRHGQGKVLVGVDENDPDFSSVNKVGGEKKHALVVSSPDKSEIGAYQSGREAQSYGLVGNGGFGDRVLITNVGGGTDKVAEPHNNLQPFTTVYMWRRMF